VGYGSRFVGIAVNLEIIGRRSRYAYYNFCSIWVIENRSSLSKALFQLSNLH